MARPLTSAPLPLVQSRSVATKQRCRCGAAWTIVRPLRQKASSTGAAWVGGVSTSTPSGRKASALCTRTSPKPIASGNPKRRKRPSARSRSANSGTGTSPRRLAALLTAWSGRNPPRRRSRDIDRYVASAPWTRWARTSRTRQPSHQDAEFHAVSSSDSTWSANWRRRRAASCRTSTIHDYKSGKRQTHWPRSLAPNAGMAAHSGQFALERLGIDNS
jgi:hypothetical protein